MPLTMIDFSEPTTAKGIRFWGVRQLFRVDARIRTSFMTYPDLAVDVLLLLVKFIIVVGVHLQVVEGEFLLDTSLELLSLLQRERIGFGDNGNDVDDVGELLQHDNVDRLQ